MTTKMGSLASQMRRQTSQNDQLSRSEQNLRRVCIQRVKQGLIGLVDVAQALRELRDGRLYRSTHKTWASFCRDEFGLTRKHVDRKISSAWILDVISSGSGNGTSDVPFLPSSEAQLAELAPLPEAKWASAWQDCIDIAGGKQPTARQVRTLVNEKLGRPAARQSYPQKYDREAVRRALVFLRSVSQPTQNITAAIDLLSREIDSSGTKSAIEKQPTYETHQ